MKKLLTIGIIALLCAVIYLNNESAKKEGWYEGTIISKAQGGGRSNMHYFEIDWDDAGVEAIPVHPITYQKLGAGDRYGVFADHKFFIGIWGTSRLPNHAYPPIYFSPCLFLVICLFVGGFIGGMIEFVRAMNR